MNYFLCSSGGTVEGEYKDDSCPSWVFYVLLGM